MIGLLKKILPLWLKQFVRKIIKIFKYRYRRMEIASAVRRGRNLKIIVGAAETFHLEWYSTNEQWLDITDLADWKRVFRGKRIVTHVVAEHVFEHLTLQEAMEALRLIAIHLVDGGRIRIASPDGYHPDENYIRHVDIGGIGDDAEDHKQLLNVDTLSEMLRKSGFKTVHIEGYNANGELIKNPWSSEDGFVRRSRMNELKNSWGFTDAGTSLIVDGIKK